MVDHLWAKFGYKEGGVFNALDRIGFSVGYIKEFATAEH
jgi:hypothetical protein